MTIRVLKVRLAAHIGIPFLTCANCRYDEFDPKDVHENGTQLLFTCMRCGHVTMTFEEYLNSSTRRGVI